MTISFLRNKVVEVEALSDGSLAVSWRLTDDILRAEIDLRVQPPDLEIVEATARVIRRPNRDISSVSETIEDVEGVRVGPGLRKIVRGLLSEAEEGAVLTDAVLESANAVILHFTLPGIQVGEKLSDEEKLARTRENLKTNPRLVRSCIAFADDSPIMQGLDL